MGQDSARKPHVSISVESCSSQNNSLKVFIIVVTKQKIIECEPFANTSVTEIYVDEV